MTPRPAGSAAAPGWDEALSQQWLAQLELREAPLVPVLEPLLARAALRPGEDVLDVGCGAGPSTLAAARLVGAGGRVTGVDVFAGMVERGRQRGAAELTGDDARVEWLAEDAQTYPFEPASYDVVLSRFGVMFFADPDAAFANLAGACRPGGRLTAAVWARRSGSEFFDRPLQVLARAAGRLGVALDLPEEDRGPFALGRPERLTGLLERTGWVDVRVEADQRLLYLGGAGASAERAVEFVLALGTTRSALEGQPPDVQDALRAELLSACREWRGPRGVGLPGGFFVVHAVRDARSDGAPSGPAGTSR